MKFLLRWVSCFISVRWGFRLLWKGKKGKRKRRRWRRKRRISRKITRSEYKSFILQARREFLTRQRKDQSSFPPSPTSCARSTHSVNAVWMFAVKPRKAKSVSMIWGKDYGTTAKKRKEEGEKRTQKTFHKRKVASSFPPSLSLSLTSNQPTSSGLLCDQMFSSCCFFIYFLLWG